LIEFNSQAGMAAAMSEMERRE